MEQGKNENKYKNTYESLNELVNDKIFQEELELIYVSQELQMTQTAKRKPLERFCLATALMKASDGKFYKIVLQEDDSYIDEDKDTERFTVQEADSVAVRMIGSWETEETTAHVYVRPEQRVVATYNYYLPKGTGKHLIKVTSQDIDTIKLGDYCTMKAARMEGKVMAIIDDYSTNMTDKHNGKKIDYKYLENLADELGLEKAYYHNFSL